MNSSTRKPLALICGAGTGLGASLCSAFVEAGYQVVGLNRSMPSVQPEKFDIQELDCSDSLKVQTMIADIVAKYGPPDVYIHNPAHLVIKPLLDVDANEFEQSWKSMVLSAFIMLQQIIPPMVEAGRGTVIASGATASMKGSARFAAFASAKFALRGLIQSVAREYQAQGIHAVHVVLDGVIDTPRSRELHSMDPALMMSADDLAQAYLSLTQQPSSVWTQELDLRTLNEKF